MKNLTIARRYAKALLIIGKEDGNAETYREELEGFAGLMSQEKDLEQAICNLVLSRAICGKEHYTIFSDNEYRKKIITFLQSRFEQADGVDSIAELTLDSIQYQIELDSKFLLSHYNVRPKATSIRELLGQLCEEGLLGD